MATLKIRELAQQTPPPVRARVLYHRERIENILTHFDDVDQDREFLINEIKEELRDIETIFNPAMVANPERVQLMEQQRVAAAGGEQA